MLAATTAFVLFITSAHARPSDGIAAIVNGDIITHSALADRLQMIVSSSNLPKAKAFRQKIAPQVLTTLVAETLQLQEAERLGLTPTEQEISNGINTIAKQNKLTDKKFQAVMRRQGVPVHSLKNQIKAQIAWSKVIQSQLRPRVIITDNDVEAEVERRTNLMGKKEFNISEIFIPVLNDEGEAEARKTANNLVRQIRNKTAPFGVLARRFSQSASAAGGGAIGWIAEGALNPVLDAALPSLTSGRISEPLRTDDGYVILQVSGIRNAGKENTTIDAEAVRRELGMKRIEIMQRRHLRELRSAAYVETRVE